MGKLGYVWLVMLACEGCRWCRPVLAVLGFMRFEVSLLGYNSGSGVVKAEAHALALIVLLVL